MKKKTAKPAEKAPAKKTPRKTAATPAAVDPTPVALQAYAGTVGIRDSIGIMSDQGQGVPARLQAIRTVQAASFGDPDFDALRGDYFAALRKLSDDPAVDVRQEALGILAREGDPFAEKALMAGLLDAKKALVPAGDALHYLSYNLHAGVQNLARSIFDSSQDQDSRQQALRLMSTDPASTKTILKTLSDKGETPAMRQLSAAALHALDPKALQTFATKAVLDENEHSDVVTACLTAMNHFGDEKAITGNTALKQRIESLRQKSPAKIKQIAKKLGVKYGF